MWASNLAGLPRAYFRLEKLMEQHCPAVLRHILKDLTISIIAPQYFLTLFLYNLVWPCCLRVFDYFLLDGPSVIYSTALALFQIHNDKILSLSFEELITFVKFSHQIDHQLLAKKIHLFISIVKKELPKLDTLYDKYNKNKPKNK